MKRLLLVAAVLFCVVVAVLLSWVSRSTPYVRDHIIATLNAHFSSRVDADMLQVGVFPRPFVSGKGLQIRYNGRTDVPPLISVGQFDATAGVSGLLRSPLHLHRVSVDHFNIYVPTDGIDGKGGDHHTPPHDDAAMPKPVATSGARVASELQIDEIVTRAVRLEIASGKPGRLPRVWDIDHLTMTGYGDPDGARFTAGLMNAIPRGHIDTSGSFGPWSAADPGLTPVRGEYRFEHANLDDIDGISGILSSTGSYHGVLNRLQVEGETNTPDFGIDVGGQRLPLSTRFKAVVDGTNGDTWLDRVEATLGRSTIIAKGAVVRTEQLKGRKVALDVQIPQGRLEDLIKLAVKGSRSPITGRIEMATKFLLPAGHGKVGDRLQLDGHFNLAQARFTNVDIQKKITMLSQRSRGDDKADGTGESIVSNLRGTFVLRRAELSFSDLSFAVPGATVQLTGTYALRGEQMAFTGYLLTDASLADMTHGWRAMLAHLAQPLFRRKGGGSKLPIRITGTRANPSFGLDLKRVFSRS